VTEQSGIRATDVEHLRRIRKLLAGGDRRSIGRSAQVVADVLAHPERFGAVIDAISDDDPVIRMRAADVAEKITAQRPELLGAYKRLLLDDLARASQAEVRWHVAQMLPRLTLAEGDHHAAVAILVDYLDDHSRIVTVNAMQALTDFARADASLRPRVIELLEPLTERGSPAIRARGRKLLAALRTR